ncbi:MAG TPA: hypothetical protein VEL07_03275 [Planctomycetota bacterium]|nr:hypothetical protein [Planctomycetota bacterium]
MAIALLIACAQAVHAAADPVLPPLVDEPVDGPINGAFLGQLTDRTRYANQVGADGRLDVTLLIRDLPADAVTGFALQGFGGGLWQHRADGGPTPNWAADLIRVGAGSQAYVVFSTPGAAFPHYDLQFTFAGGATASVTVQGGPVDANRWSAAYQGAPEWRGATSGSDLTGFRKGPDGVHDDEIHLAGLYPGLGVKRIVITRGARRWTTGPMTAIDEGNADIVGTAPGRASVFFQDEIFASGRYEITVTYDSDAVMSCGVDAAQPTAPGAVVDAMPATAPPIALAVEWIGQDPASGLVTLASRGQAESGDVILAEIVDGAGVWRHVGPAAAAHPGLVPTTGASALVVAGDAARGRTFSFLPTADLRGRDLSLRLVLATPAIVHGVGAVVGGASDPAAGQAAPEDTAITAQPGDDLNALALTHGRIALALGDYAMGEPLRLTRPIEITGPRTARILFHQGASDPAWTRAIELCVGRTTLRGFTVGFSAPVRFRPESIVSYGSAVIGTVVDRHVPDRRAGLRLEDLAIEGPAATGSWDEAVHLIVMKDSGGGAIRGNTLRGGTVRLLGGPWEVVGNHHLGALVDTFSHGAFACHFTHDLTLTGNRLTPDVAIRARTWRFLVVTSWGSRCLVADNEVVGVGERDDDEARGIPQINAPEVVLTESYHTVFEGVPTSLGADGRVLRIPGTLAGALGERGAVTVLDGDAAGTWSRIVHVINARECIVDPPLRALASGAPPAVNISDGGFRGFEFARNRIDLRVPLPRLRGSPTALVLAGNHYGSRVVGNHFLGALPAHIVAAPTEHQPFRWGWGYAPVAGLTLTGNVFEDTGRVFLGPEHGPPIKGGCGRTYFSADIRDNRFRYSPAWLAAHPGTPLALVIGSTDAPDPRESRVRWSGNAVERDDGQVPGATTRMHAIVDGVPSDGDDQPVPAPVSRRGDGDGAGGGCGIGAVAAVALTLLTLLVERRLVRAR